MLTLIPIFLGIGFMIAVLYTDLVFDISALPFRKSKEGLPRNVLDPIVAYYGTITKRPWLLLFVMLTTMVCLVAQAAWQLVPKWIGYFSLVLFGTSMLLGALRVIPAAQRLASGKESSQKQMQLIRSLFPCHVFLLVSILTLAMLQFGTLPR